MSLLKISKDLVESLKLIELSDNAVLGTGDLIPFKMTISGLKDGKVPNNLIGTLAILGCEEDTDTYYAQIWDYKGKPYYAAGLKVSLQVIDVGNMDIMTDSGHERYRSLTILGVNPTEEGKAFIEDLRKEVEAKATTQVSFHLLMRNHYSSEVIKSALDGLNTKEKKNEEKR